MAPVSRGCLPIYRVAGPSEGNGERATLGTAKAVTVPWAGANWMHRRGFCSSRQYFIEISLKIGSQLFPSGTHGPADPLLEGLTGPIRF